MAVAGNTSAFAECFRDGLVAEILATLLAAWERMPKPSRHTIETRLTRRYGFFVQLEKSRRGLPFRVHVEHSLTDPLTFEESGRIDLCLQPGSHREELYFAFECKRLRIPYAKAVTSNTTAYVGTAGMGAFISGQYAAGLPHGGMIGYVMDGKLAPAKTSLQQRIAAEANALLLVDQTDLQASRHHPGEGRLAETLHQLTTGSLVLHHVLLPL
jgi:hypothetical protein